MQRSGGGVFMDMGCHGIAFCYWFLGRPEIKSVLAHMGTYVHGEKTVGEDDCLCVIDFANGAKGVVEDSWARRGGMEDRIEVYGEGGVTYADLHMGNALPTYSEYGYGYDVMIGGMPQINERQPDWRTLFLEKRLLTGAFLAHRNGNLPLESLRLVERFAVRCGDLIPEPKAPALLHGDLWRGNILCARDGRASRVSGFIDPAMY